MKIVHGRSAEHWPELMADMARYRHRVFVERLGWPLHSEDGLEFDEFDRPDTLYIVAQNDFNEVIGTARLLSTVRPYLLDKVFPQLLGGLPAPASPEIWELSRFAAVDFSVPGRSPSGQFSSAIAVELLQATLVCAASRGARRLITVSPLGIERLLRKAGFQSQRAGPPVLVDGCPLFACWIPISNAVRRASSRTSQW